MSAHPIIIVEDDNILSLFFKSVLEQHDYKVIGVFNNGTDAIDFVKQNKVEAVIMDIGLKSELNGIETAQIIKEIQDTHIVFITGNTSKEVYEKARFVSPSNYIVKPVGADELVQKVDFVVKSFTQISKKENLKKEFQIKSIIEEIGDRPLSFFGKYLEKENTANLVISTNTRFNIINQPEDTYDLVVNLKKLNNCRYINKFLEAVNHKLPIEGIFIGHAETKGLRKRMILKKYPFGLNFLIYFFYFITKRAWPKIPLFKQLYFFITKGRNRTLSRAEVLGRLISCGFEILEEDFIDSNLHFIVKKIKEPSYDMNASYDLIFKMKRVGKNGKPIYVYKFRTMHPYAEYLHAYILNLKGYSETGKPAEDFRLTTWGRILRKYWLDELPQLLNVLKGDMKLVGIRPVSYTYFEQLPKDLQELRVTQKPGCIPPYVSLDRNSNVDSVLEAEREYIEEKMKHPFKTDIKYFFKAVFNVIFKMKRSA